ncbi:MAG: hypothetical protein HQM08_10035 [Candidatus Riflebacteria bacterium]|nr:hypothetical protein [Candidatus Riflebacteria bacterium]
MNIMQQYQAICGWGKPHYISAGSSPFTPPICANSGEIENNSTVVNLLKKLLKEKYNQRGSCKISKFKFAKNITMIIRLEFLFVQCTNFIQYCKKLQRTSFLLLSELSTLKQSGNSPRNQIKSGITLVELVFAIFCMMLLLPSIWTVLQSGTKASLRGMTRVNSTIKSREILKQVCDDLANSCIEYGSSTMILDIKSAILPENSVPPYSFFVFPHHGNIEDFFVSPKTGGESKILAKPYHEGGSLPPNQTGRVERLLNLVTYDLVVDPSGKNFLKKLVRKEKFNTFNPLAKSYENGTKIEILSESVQNFNIRHETFLTTPNSNRTPVIAYFWVSIQLVDVPPGVSSPESPVDPLSVPNGLVISDLFDVVCPKFLNERFNSGSFNQNWHIGAVGSPDKAGD